MEKAYYRRLQQEETDFVNKYGFVKYSPDIIKEHNKLKEKWKGLNISS